MLPPPPGGAPSSNGQHHEPPHDDAVERTVVGACLIFPECVPSCAARVKPRDFYRYKHEVIFDAVLATHAQHGASSTPLLVIEELKRRRRLADAGGNDEIIAIFTETITAAGIEQHADVVASASKARSLLDLGRRLEEQVRAHPEDPLGHAQRVIEELRGLSEGKEKKKSLGRSWLSFCDDPELEWLIEGVLPKGGLSLLVGDPSAGKSALAVDIALRAMHGMEWLGRKIAPHSTLYFCGEGQGGIPGRMRTWRKAHEAEHPQPGLFFDIVPMTPNLLEPGALQEITAEIARCKNTYGSKPDVVIFDTLTTATAGCDQSDMGAIGKALAVLSHVRDEHGCTTEPLHHLRKPSGERSAAREDIHSILGSIAIAGACDAVLMATRKDDERKLTAVKMRDGEDGVLIGRYTIKPMATGRIKRNGQPEMGPLLLPASLKPEVQVDLAAEEAADEARVLESMRDLKTTTKIDTVVRHAKMNLAIGRLAFDRLMSKGQIKAAFGRGGRATYSVVI